MLRASLGKHLRFARIAAGFSYADAGAVVGLKPETIRAYENELRVPSTLVTLRLIRAYGVTPNDVLESVVFPQEVIPGD